MRKNMIPELMRANPDARLIIVPGRLKFLMTMSATVTRANMVRYERKVGSARPVCVSMEFVWALVRRA